MSEFARSLPELQESHQGTEGNLGIDSGDGTRTSVPRLNSPSKLRIIDHLAKNGTGWAYTMADDSIPEPTIRSAAKVLQEEGVIRPCQRVSSSQGPDRVIYELVDPRATLVALESQQLELENRLTKAMDELKRQMELYRGTVDTLASLRIAATT